MTTYMIFVDSEKASRTLPFNLDVEESAKLGCVVVYSRKLKRKLYFKEGDKTKDGTVLIPLSREELKAINIEESVNDVLLPFEIEESAQNEGESNDEWAKRRAKEMREEMEGHKVNMNDVESVKKGKEILEEREAELEGKPSREELEVELEDKKAKLEIVAEKELEKRMNALNIPEAQRNYFRENPSSLKAYEMGKSQLPSPNTPLNEAQFGNPTSSIWQKPFDNYEDMVRALKEAEKLGDAQAKEILNRLMQKSLLGARKAQLGKEPENQPSLKEITRKKKRSE